MADNNKLELVVEVDVNKANASIKSINTGLSSMEQAAGKAARPGNRHDCLGHPGCGRLSHRRQSPGRCSALGWSGPLLDGRRADLGKHDGNCFAGGRHSRRVRKHRGELGRLLRRYSNALVR